MLNIIKSESGNVLLNSDNRYEFLKPSQNFKLAKDGDTIEVYELGRLTTSFKYSEVGTLQILPAAATAKPATARELLDELNDNFFFDLGGSGGIISESLVLEAYTPIITISGNVDDFVVANLDNVTTMYIDVTSGGLAISGLQAPTGGKRQFLQVVNIGANGLSAPRESVSSVAENRFWGESTGTVFAVRRTTFLVYDNTILTGRWRYF